MGKVGISFAIGGSIAAVIMVIGMITIVADTATPATSTLGLQGIYTIKIMDPDGNIKAYIQTTNAPTHHFKNCLIDGFFGTTLSGANTCVITTATIEIGDAGDQGPDDSRTGLFQPYTNSGSGTALGNGGVASATGGGDPEASITFTNAADPITIQQADLDATTPFNTGGSADTACIDEGTDTFVDCFLDEVGLFDADGDMVSHATFTKTQVSVGDQVDVSLLITLS